MTHYEAAFRTLTDKWHESVKHYEDRIEKLEDTIEVMQHQLKELQWSFDCKDDLHKQDYERMKKYLDRIEKLEAALRNIAEGDIPRTVKIPFRDDGQSSKHDRCEHGQWFYEDCGCCVEDYARKALDAE
jgi:Na+/phosphate symporter